MHVIRDLKCNHERRCPTGMETAPQFVHKYASIPTPDSKYAMIPLTRDGRLNLKNSEENVEIQNNFHE
jgi:hypothetical protein